MHGYGLLVAERPRKKQGRSHDDGEDGGSDGEERPPASGAQVPLEPIPEHDPAALHVDGLDVVLMQAGCQQLLELVGPHTGSASWWATACRPREACVLTEPTEMPRTSAISA